MKVLQVTPYFAPAWAYGGPPRSIFELSRELVRKGHSVTVLTTDALDSKRRASPAHEVLDGVDVFRLRNLSNYSAWQQQLFLPVGVGRALRRRLGDFDLVHLNVYRTILNLIVYRHVRQDGLPFVLSARGTIPLFTRGRLAKQAFDRVAGARLLRSARRAIALSTAERDDYVGAGVDPSRISVVLNGIDSSVYERLPTKGDFAAALRIRGRRIVTYLGRLHPRKGLEYLLEAFRRLSLAQDDVVLALVGPDNGHRRHLEELSESLSIADRVFFPGMVSTAGKLQVLVDSDVIVYPAEHEVFGRVPFEALLCGTPVVVTGDSGCGEIIRRANAGYVVPFADPGSLQKAIARCLDLDDGVRAMIGRGQRFIKERLNWRVVAREMEEAYDIAVNSPGNPPGRGPEEARSVSVTL